MARELDTHIDHRRGNGGTDPRSDWQKRQAERCSCKGSDDMCPCQNVDFSAPRPALALTEASALAVLDEISRAEGWGGADMRFVKQDQPTIVRAMLRFANDAALREDALRTAIGQGLDACPHGLHSERIDAIVNRIRTAEVQRP